MDVVEGTVRTISDLSPTVRGLKLFVASKEFTFKPGQWVDFLVPNISEVAGYSICSSPKLLQETSEIELAVKFSEFPPTKWIHEKCQVGSKVGLVAGGDFFYTPQPSDRCRDLLLVAGGVGINPLVSIMRHVADLKAAKGQGLPGRLILAYSARSAEELVFKNEIGEIVANSDAMKAKFFITHHDGQSLDDVKGVDVFTNRRIDRETLALILSTDFVDVKNVDCYVCGPSSMIDDVDRILLDLRVSPDQIKYEKWW